MQYNAKLVLSLKANCQMIFHSLESRDFGVDLARPITVLRVGRLVIARVRPCAATTGQNIGAWLKKSQAQTLRCQAECMLGKLPSALTVNGFFNGALSQTLAQPIPL